MPATRSDQQKSYSGVIAFIFHRNPPAQVMKLLPLSLLLLLPISSGAFLIVHSVAQYSAFALSSSIPKAGNGKVSLYMDGFSSIDPDLERAKVSKLNKFVVGFSVYVLIFYAFMARNAPNALESVH